MEDELFRKVIKWTRMLEKEDKIEHALRRLESLEINLQLLSETGPIKLNNAFKFIQILIFLKQVLVKL
jgi:hypothetical protein